MSKQLDYTRQAVLTFVKELDEETADKTAIYFNNTIRWHIGHIITTPESLLFGFPKQSTNIPERYAELFGTGTKPADWKGEVPTLPELIDELNKQKERMNKQLTDEFLAQDLPFELPFGNFKTFGDVFEMVLQHENEHLGKMKAMKQVVTSNA